MARFDCFMLKSLSVEYGRTRQDLKCARAVFRPLFLIYCYRDCGGGGAGRAIAHLPLFSGIYCLGLQLTWRKFLKIIGLCPKRWTVRASCFRLILENYAVLMEEWDVFLSEQLQPNVRSRIIGYKA